MLAPALLIWFRNAGTSAPRTDGGCDAWPDVRASQMGRRDPGGSPVKSGQREPREGVYVFENTLNKHRRPAAFLLASQRHSRDEWSCKGTTMTHYPYILFNQSPQQLRRIGARGGKARARNRRLRLWAQAQGEPPIAACPDRVTETTAEAIALLDAQFPWLRGAEKRSIPARRQRWNATMASPPARKGDGKAMVL